MNEVIDRSLGSRRFSADLAGGLAGLALLLASIGIYGLLAYMVGQECGFVSALSVETNAVLQDAQKRWDVCRA
jgi:hypothetical protein